MTSGGLVKVFYNSVDSVEVVVKNVAMGVRSKGMDTKSGPGDSCDRESCMVL